MSFSCETISERTFSGYSQINASHTKYTIPARKSIILHDFGTFVCLTTVQNYYAYRS